MLQDADQLIAGPRNNHLQRHRSDLRAGHMELNLNNQVVVVVGAAGGIGQAVAAAFAEVLAEG